LCPAFFPIDGVHYGGDKVDFKCAKQAVIMSSLSILRCNFDAFVSTILLEVPSSVACSFLELISKQMLVLN